LAIVAPNTLDRGVTYLLLVRHGVTPTTGKVLPGRAPGLSLSDAGRAEAAEVGRRVGGLGKVRALYSSPMERALETAEQIVPFVGLPVEIEPDLIECDAGVWTGVGLRALRNRRDWKRLLANPSGFRFPGGESFIELQARVLAAAERLVARHRGGVVVAVSHADPIKVALASALGSPLDLLQRIEVGTCSVNVVAYGEGPPRVLTLNSFADPALVGVPLGETRRRSASATRRTAPLDPGRRGETGTRQAARMRAT
jgi:probable phosphoglycerate mutase